MRDSLLPQPFQNTCETYYVKIDFEILGFQGYYILRTYTNVAKAKEQCCVVNGQMIGKHAWKVLTWWVIFHGAPQGSKPGTAVFFDLRKICIIYF